MPEGASVREEIIKVLDVGYESKGPASGSGEGTDK
jgi:hypothetical protein